MRGFPSDADGYAGSLSCPRDVSAVTGACLMMRKEEYLQSGGLVEYYGTHYQDVDICLCFLTSGRRIVYVPYAVLIHYEGASRGRDYDHLDRALLLDRWGEVITRGDPYYNPNFSLDSADYSIG
jgi:GT2 family glycosyltransferase